MAKSKKNISLVAKNNSRVLSQPWRRGVRAIATAFETVIWV
jgi:lambda repressor-like predicted transcriptional regulator